jgi:hypothetical protein
MSLRALKKAIQRDSGRATCGAFGRPEAGFQYCVIKLARSGGDIFALLDARGRVAAIQLFQLAGKGSLAEEAARASTAWRRVATSAAIVPHVVSELPRTAEGREITYAEGIACDVPEPRPVPSTISLP